MSLAVALGAGIALARASQGPVVGTRMDVDLYGNTYVIDSDRNTLILCSKDGALAGQIGGSGWLNDQFDHPAGIWAKNGIDVFVADQGNHRIQRFDRHLNYVSTLFTRDSDDPNQRFGYPSDVALSRQGELFICDTENGRIVKVDQSGRVGRTFGGFGGGKGRLAAPRSLGLGPKDAIYVLDEERVAVFDAFGNYLRDLLPGAFTRPTGLFADNDIVVVMDSETLFFFDTEERPQGTFAIRTVIPAGADVRSFALGGGTLYLLTSEGIITVPDPRPKKTEGDR